MRKVTDSVFRICMAVFLCVGTGMVLLQLLGVAVNAPSIINWSAAGLAPFVYILASIAGLIAFGMSYTRRWEEPED